MEIKTWYVPAIVVTVVVLAGAYQLGYLSQLAAWYELNKNLILLIVLAAVVLFFLLQPKTASVLDIPRVISFSDALEQVSKEGTYEAWVYTCVKTLYRPNTLSGGFSFTRLKNEDGVSKSYWQLKFPWLDPILYPNETILYLDVKKFPVPEGTRFRGWFDSRSANVVLGGRTTYQQVSGIMGYSEKDTMKHLAQLLESGDISSGDYVEAQKALAQSNAKNEGSKQGGV